MTGTLAESRKNQPDSNDKLVIPAMTGRHGPIGIPEDILGRIGPLEVRLATTQDEISAAQEVRFRVFYEELGAKVPTGDCGARRDVDQYDEACDHLIVLDTMQTGPANGRIVATYRLLRQERVDAANGFYSERTFQLRSLMRRHPTRRFLELGRSCVLPEYRSRRTMELLWQGIWSYCRHYRIHVMIGCASFAGRIPEAHAQCISHLAHRYRASRQWDMAALPHCHHNMDLMPEEAIDGREAFAAMPPLIRGYLRLGAMIGDGCVVDELFETVVVAVILPVEMISERYRNYFSGTPARMM